MLSSTQPCFPVFDLTFVIGKIDHFLLDSCCDIQIILVCLTSDVPENTIERDDGWLAFRVAGVLDFSLIGILSKLSTILAENKIGIFAVSTYNTDYILTKEKDFVDALEVLTEAGIQIV